MTSTTSSCLTLSDLPVTGRMKPGLVVTQGEGQQLHHCCQGELGAAHRLNFVGLQKDPNLQATGVSLFSQSLFHNERERLGNRPALDVGTAYLALGQGTRRGETRKLLEAMLRGESPLQSSCRETRASGTEHAGSFPARRWPCSSSSISSQPAPPRWGGSRPRCWKPARLLGCLGWGVGASETPAPSVLPLSHWQ